MEAIHTNIKNVAEAMRTAELTKQGQTDKNVKETKQETISESDTTVNEEQAKKIAKGVDDFLKLIQTDLQVEIHQETKTPVFKIVRTDDNKVIKEVPPKVMLDIAVNIKNMVGSFVDDNA